MDFETRLKIRRYVSEVQILRHNMYVTARFTQNEWRTLELTSYLMLCDSLEEINKQLGRRYLFIYETLKEYNLEFLYGQLGIFER